MSRSRCKRTCPSSPPASLPRTDAVRLSSHFHLGAAATHLKSARTSVLEYGETARFDYRLWITASRCLHTTGPNTRDTSDCVVVAAMPGHPQRHGRSQDPLTLSPKGEA